MRVSYQYPAELMWQQVRDRARRTVGKESLGSAVSASFKAELCVSEHSPLRELRFVLHFRGIPTYIAQQFSRHRISLQNPGDYQYLEENIAPADVEHYVRTQRSDRTGEARGSQEAPIDYDCIINAQGLIDMSKKRLCMAADPKAHALWLEVKKGVAVLEPMLAAMLVPSCLYRGFCPEVRMNCAWLGSKAHNDMLLKQYAVVEFAKK